jgi:transcriptional regulator with XRE-family HTH domain
MELNKIILQNGIQRTARQLGVDAVTVWRHVKGQRKPSIEMLLAYSALFDVDIKCLLNEFYRPPALTGRRLE